MAESDGGIGSGLRYDRIVHVDEATQFNTSVDLLLKECCDGNIEILVEVPPVYEPVLQSERPSLGPQTLGRVTTAYIPEYLALEPEHCASLLRRKGEIRVYQTRRGFRRGGYTIRNEPTSIIRLDAAEMIGVDKLLECVNWQGEKLPNQVPLSWSYWCFHSNSRPIDLGVRRDDLFVRQSDLTDLLGLQMDVHPSTVYTPLKSLSKDEAPPYISSKLMRLWEAANKFWADVDLEDRDRYPKSGKISQWFSDVGFSASLAEAASTIIRPDRADSNGGRPSK